jgi:hypothetical protein
MIAPLEDIEIVMHLFRLARSGNYALAADLLKAALEDFPDEPKERIERCLVDLANRTAGQYRP